MAYKSPNSIETENEKINNFIRTLGTLKHSQNLVLGGFNRKDIDWLSLSAQSEKLIEDLSKPLKIAF